MSRDFNLKYGGRGVKIDVAVVTTEESQPLMQRLRVAARGPALNMCLIGFAQVPGGHRFTLILNTNEAVEDVMQRCRDAVNNMGTVECGVVGEEISARETQEVFNHASWLAEMHYRRN